MTKGIESIEVNPQRRRLLKGAALGMASLTLPAMPVFASSPSSPKLVWVLLRGALDSLHTVIPSFDKDYASLRPTLAKAFDAAPKPIDRGFFLHPSLANLHKWYLQGDLLPVVATNSGYTERSHFDGQDYIESGLAQTNHDSGWLARAIEAKQAQALAVARATPISLRGVEQAGASVNTWYPSNLKDSDEDIYLQLQNLYQNDPQLLSALEDGMALKMQLGKQPKTQKSGQFVELAKACGRLLSSQQQGDCAMLELGGWDTHNNQSGRLNRQLATLDKGLQALRDSLGQEWDNTVVIVATEFGRTAKENGTKGTDHGSASAMFLAGGAVAGGKVAGEWPGLASSKLYKNRDLAPTSNMYGWIGAVLKQHWQLSDVQIAKVFPQQAAYPQRLIQS
ncbi:DUF1501 domain-containing protein [Paraferrimonas sedimenticola]|uniref:DUF1501 domain-containing protein n=1 Tax=Paraferrimonas sedimenticola TaxID=375674 RepID=A0AA37RXL0_9GAMM|nr:DUF1501 domain-containing protein [Paraferrimonas sedimenticola]GLP97020.1 hypothetical protein GCM10007895_23260 [Paraferrimonas sedimenticola]